MYCCVLPPRPKNLCHLKLAFRNISRRAIVPVPCSSCLPYTISAVMVECTACKSKILLLISSSFSESQPCSSFSSLPKSSRRYLRAIAMHICRHALIFNSTPISRLPCSCNRCRSRSDVQALSQVHCL